MLNCPKENTGRQIFRILVITGPVVDIAVNLVHIARIKFAERLLILLGLLNQELLIYIRIISIITASSQSKYPQNPVSGVLSI
jgi:hypothetical protein